MALKFVISFLHQFHSNPVTHCRFHFNRIVGAMCMVTHTYEHNLYFQFMNVVSLVSCSVASRQNNSLLTGLKSTRIRLDICYLFFELFNYLYVSLSIVLKTLLTITNKLLSILKQMVQILIKAAGIKTLDSGPHALYFSPPVLNFN